MLYNIYYIYIGWLMGYIYIYINIFPKKLQFADYGQFVLVFSSSSSHTNSILAGAVKALNIIYVV